MEEVVLDDRGAPEFRIREQAEDGLTVPVAVLFDGPPQHERLAGIAGVAVVREQSLDHGHGLGGGEAAGGRRELRSGLDVGFACRLFGDGGCKPGTHLPRIALETGRPEADLGVRVTEGLSGERVVEESDPVGGPETFEGEVGSAGGGWGIEPRGEGLVDSGIVGLREEAQRLLTDEAVGVGEMGEECGGRWVASRDDRAARRSLLPAKAVDAAVGGVHLAFVVPVVVHLAVVPIANVERAVGPELDVNGTEEGVAGADRVAEVAGAEGGAVAGDLGHHDPALEGFDAEQAALVGLAEGTGVVEDEVVGEAVDVVVANGGEVAVGMGIRERTVLVEALLEIGALLVVESAGVAAVVAGKDPPGGIKLEAEGVSAAFAEDLVNAAFRVVTPDVLALGVDRLRVERSAFRGVDEDVAGDGGTLAAVKPPIRSPTQRVGDRMGVLQPESRESDLGIGVGFVVVIGVRIEQQVRRVQDPDPAAVQGDAGGDVESVDEGRVAVEGAVAVGVLVDADAVGALEVVWRGRRDLVVDGAPEVVPGNHLQACGVWVLAVLDDPHPAAFVEGEEDGLGDVGFGQDLIPGEVGRDLEPSGCLGGRQRIDLCGWRGLGGGLNRGCRLGGSRGLGCGGWLRRGRDEVVEGPQDAVEEETLEGGFGEVFGAAERGVEDAAVVAGVDPGDRFDLGGAVLGLPPEQGRNGPEQLAVAVEVGRELLGCRDAGQDRVTGGFRNDRGEGVLAWTFAVMLLVVGPEDLLVEVGPGTVGGVRLAPEFEGVAGGADADDGFAGGDVVTEGLDHAGGWTPATDAQDEQVGIADGFPVLEVMVVVLGGGRNHVKAVAPDGQLVPGECGQGLPGAVLVFADDEGDALGLVALEAELGTGEEVGTGDAWAPELLDVFNDKFGAPEMGDEGAFAVVVHRVRHVADEDDVLTLTDHLADGEGAAEDAHVDVDAHDDDVGDAALAHEVEGLGGIGDGVAGKDLERGVLAGPGLEGRAIRTAIAAAVRVVDGQGSFDVGLEGTPTFEGNRGGDLGGGLGEFPAGMVLVEVHGVGRAVDDEATAGAGGPDHLVHPGGHLPDAFGGVRAVVLVPHVTDDDGGAGGFPLGGGVLEDPVVGVLLRSKPGAGAEWEGFRLCRQGGRRDEREKGEPTGEALDGHSGRLAGMALRRQRQAGRGFERLDGVSPHPVRRRFRWGECPTSCQGVPSFKIQVSSPAPASNLKLKTSNSAAAPVGRVSHEPM